MSVIRHFGAFAKINLDLRVLYRRPDGFHELRTVFQTISLEDDIGIRYEPSSQVAIAIESTVAIENNLIAKAAELVANELRSGGDFVFELKKRIPMGAGLGGGSSDAATVLRALPRLIGRPIPPERLHAMALTLGSDVPFFLYGGTALGLGRGEELYPLSDLRPLPGILVTPAIHVSTAEAYRELSPLLAGQSIERKLAEFRQLAWTENLAAARNDFEEAVFARHPELADIRERLSRAGAVCARMSGSGSALFGLFADERAASRARAEFPDHPTVTFTLVNRLTAQAALSGFGLT